MGNLWVRELQRTAVIAVFYSYRDYFIFGQQMLGVVSQCMQTRQVLMAEKSAYWGDI